MKSISKIGPMYLLEIKSIRRQILYSNNIYIVSFGDCKLAVTDLHAFTCIDGISKKASELCGKDKIWVDVHAFTADGSFTTVH